MLPKYNAPCWKPVADVALRIQRSAFQVFSAPTTSHVVGIGPRVNRFKRTLTGDFEL